MNGFELLEQVAASFHFDVIFTTAYDQYAIRAFQHSALHYLLKPVQEDELRTAIDLWHKRTRRQLQQAQFSLFRDQYTLSSPEPPSRIALPTHEGHEIVNVPEIIRCAADAGYTHFFLKNGGGLLICRTLKEVEQVLELNGFLRVHHSHLINPTYLQKIVRQDGGYLLMADGAQVPVTKPKRDLLLAQFGSIDRNG